MVHEHAWAEVAAARAPALLRLAVMLTGDPHDAQDLVQATMLKAQRHGDRIAAMGAPAAYLRTALVREHMSTVRQRRRRPHSASLVEAETLADHVDRTEDVARRDHTWRLLADLPTRQRAVLALRYYEDLDDVEIATVLGCSHATVRSHAARALTTLRTRLAEETP